MINKLFDWVTFWGYLMKKCFLIFLITFLFGCAHKKDTRRSDFVSGCFLGSYQVLSSLEIALDLDALTEYCIIIHDSSEDIDSKLDELDKYMPQKKIAPQNKLKDFLNAPKSKEKESDSFYYL